jgi:hypothetical protein
MPVASMLETDRIIGRPGHDVRGSGCHDLIAAGAAIVLVRCGSADLPDIPVTIGMTLTTLTSQRVQRSFVVAAIIDAAILTTHD